MKRVKLLSIVISFIFMGLSSNLLAQEPAVLKLNTTTYRIRSLADLDEVASKVNDPDNWWKSSGNTFILEADIATFTNTIGTEASPFCGIFDGNGHMITVNIYKPLLSMVGLFGKADYATITRLTVAGSVSGAVNVAGVVGWGKIPQ